MVAYSGLTTILPVVKSRSYKPWFAEERAKRKRSSFSASFASASLRSVMSLTAASATSRSPREIFLSATSTSKSEPSSNLRPCHSKRRDSPLLTRFNISGICFTGALAEDSSGIELARIFSRVVPYNSITCLFTSTILPSRLWINKAS